MCDFIHNLSLIFVTNSFLKYLRVSSFSVYDNGLGMERISDCNTHSFTSTERKNINKLIYFFLFHDLKLNMSLCPFDKLISNIFSIVNKANLIRTRSFILSLMMIFDNLMTNYHTFKKLTTLIILTKLFNILFDILTFIDSIFYSNFFKYHLIGR